MISKILLAFDGTKSAEKALEFALDMAEKYAAELQILNVLELPVFGNPEESMAASASMAGLIKDLHKTHENILASGAMKAAKLKPNVKVTTELREGNPPTQIVTAAEQGNFNIIVIGHGSESRLREMFLGGTSERVAHLSRCPVIIVK